MTLRRVTFTWPPVPGAASYDLYENGIKVSNTTGNTAHITSSGDVSLEARANIPAPTPPPPVPTPPPPVPTPPPPASAHRFGIATGDQAPGSPRLMDGPGRDTYFANMVAAGAQSVRMDIKAVDASYIDLVARAKAHGLHVLVLLPNFADLTSLALPAIQQFGATVDYELGNELNIHAVTPAQWQSVNNATYTKMKIVSPAAKVISSGLSPWGQYGQASNGTHWNPLDYLKQALSLGPLLCDAIGWHPYPTDEKYSGNWNDVLTSPYSGWRDMVAAAAFVPGMKFAATEYGVPTLTGYATEAQQAQFIADSFAAWKTYSWADDIHIYSGLDQGTGGTNKENNFGLYRNNYSAKPAVSAFKAASV